MTLKELAAQVAAEFQKLYGHPPRWIVAAPGRVNVIGEHTDYNDGFVLPMAIERYAVMAADSAALPGKISLYDKQFKDSATIDISAPVTKGQPNGRTTSAACSPAFKIAASRFPRSTSPSCPPCPSAAA